MTRAWNRPFPMLLLLLLLLLPLDAGAQLPEEFTNLNVLPKDIDQRELVGIMRGFAGGLGVRCWYCHVGEEGKPLSTFDFASDEKKHKMIAREMMKMVGEINSTIGKIDTGSEARLEVSCSTCHHGLQRPEELREVLVATYEEKGLDGALARYHELRKEYYGRYAYDFGQGPLNMFVEFLTAKEKADEALQVQLLNAELHPDATWVHFALGQAYEGQGDKKKAAEAYRKALKADPSNRLAKQKLDALE